MPTIDELAQAAASADDDELPVSQAGSMRRVSRSMLLAGVQPALAVVPGALLGRTSAGVGAPEAIAVGAGLQMRGGVLSGAPPFSTGALPVSGMVAATDLVAVSQAGWDAAVPVGVLLGALAAVPGLDVSGQLVRVPGGAGRALSDWIGDVACPEAFGAAGDGVTDDTAAIDRAVASGRPVRFGPKTYVLNGQWTVSVSAVLMGVVGRTVLRRVSQAGGAWISVAGPSFAARGIVFDAGSLAAAGDTWGVLVTAGCMASLFEDCAFQGATGAVLGSGLVIGARDGVSGAGSRHVVRGCVASGNAVHGIWVQAAAGALVEGCDAHGNGAYGICLDFNDPAFLQQVRQGVVTGCRAWGNRRGISIGNYNETNLEPPRWGNANPDAVGVLVTGNRCHDNADYGIAISGSALQVVGNLVEASGSGILVNASSSMVSGNVVSGPVGSGVGGSGPGGSGPGGSGPGGSGTGGSGTGGSGPGGSGPGGSGTGGSGLGQFGIDAGGSVDCDITGNLVRGFAVGINPGGSRNVRVAGNGLVANTWGITAYGMETDGHGTAFGIPCSGLLVEGNRIELKDGSGGGVLLADGPLGGAVVGNAFWGGALCSPSQALWAHTDQLVMRDNVWNGQARLICNPSDTGGVQQVQVPDALDGAMLTAAPLPVSSIVGMHQAATAGQVTFVRVTAGGSRYSQATVVIGGAGSGATAVAYVRDGAVIAIAVQGGGSGCGAGTTVTISGDGAGAQAVVSVGLPVVDGRRMRLHCNGPVRFKRAGSIPFQDNWTGTDILVPQASVVEWVGAWGNWQAVSFPLADYLAPAGDGSFALRSAAGDVVVRPAGAGQMRVSSDTEPVGFACLLGRGSPEGVWAAAAGSDYRNLDGGVGSTLWVKRTASGATGWVAVA